MIALILLLVLPIVVFIFTYILYDDYKIKREFKNRIIDKVYPFDFGYDFLSSKDTDWEKLPPLINSWVGNGGKPLKFIWLTEENGIYSFSNIDGYKLIQKKNEKCQFDMVCYYFSSIFFKNFIYVKIVYKGTYTQIYGEKIYNKKCVKHFKNILKLKKKKYLQKEKERKLKNKNSKKAKKKELYNSIKQAALHQKELYKKCSLTKDL